MIAINTDKKKIRYKNCYRYIECVDHPFANSRGFITEHRLIAEQYLLNDNNSVVINNNRYLSSDFTVHHIDFNRLNNDQTNLLIIKLDEHAAMHKKLYDEQYFLSYCNKFNLNPDIVRKTRADFKSGQYKKYKNI